MGSSRNDGLRNQRRRNIVDSEWKNDLWWGLHALSQRLFSGVRKTCAEGGWQGSTHARC